MLGLLYAKYFNTWVPAMCQLCERTIIHCDYPNKKTAAGQLCMFTIYKEEIILITKQKSWPKQLYENIQHLHPLPHNLSLPIEAFHFLSCVPNRQIQQNPSNHKHRP